jgi:hypothetical protein
MGKWTKAYKTWKAYLDPFNNTVKTHSNIWTDHPVLHTTRQFIIVTTMGRQYSEPGHKTNAVVPLTDLKQKGIHYQFINPAGYKYIYPSPHQTLSTTTFQTYQNGKNKY